MKVSVLTFIIFIMYITAIGSFKMMWAVHLVLMTVIWMLTLNKKNNISKVIISISIIFIFVIIIFILKQNI